MRAYTKKIINPFLQFWFKKYYKKPRKFRYENLEILVHPEVFPPHFTISTKIILNFIKKLNLQDKTFLELGCGSGIISLYASSKGALVTATDINQIALNSLNKAKNKNQLKLEVLHSDLFENLTSHTFDYIVVNPPYYPKHPESTKDQAWFCGENFEYFQEFFKQLVKRTDLKNVIMILSQDCNLEEIKKIGVNNSFKMNIILEKTVALEKNYIFEIVKI